MKKKLFIVLILVVVFVLQGCSSGGSKKPWEELGVSKSKYDQTYNKIKYGS